MNKSRYFIGLFFVVEFSFLPLAFSYQVDERENIIQQTLDKFKEEFSSFETTPREQEFLDKELSSELFATKQSVIAKTLKDITIEVALRLGYISGDTTYNFDHDTSELKFPFDNWMGGGSLEAGYKRLFFNAQAWVPISKETGSKMTDKDWIQGILISSTESNQDVDGYILDTNLRYNFYDRILASPNESLALIASDKIRVGVLAGYRYERFDFDTYDIYDTIAGTASYLGKKVLTYQIHYRLPYLGLAADVLRNKFKFYADLKYSLFPKARDVDNHLLKALTFYGNYDEPKHAFIFSAEGDWRFTKNWHFSLGLDGAFVKIYGITWEESRDPAWNKDQNTSLAQMLIWSGLRYRF